VSTQAGRLRREIAALSPGYGAWVMATGIVSTGFALFGDGALSDALLVIACLAFALLLVGYAWRAVGYRQRALADARDPSRAFGYFSMVAAANVIAVRLALARDPTAALVLGAASVPVWLVLTYGILGAMVIGRRAGSMLPGVNGSWFLLVVATQLLSVTSSMVGASHPALTRAMAALAVALWAIGVVLYLILAVVVTLHLLELEHAPHALSPTYWIYMGATAISVLAAARILQFPASLPVIAATRDVVSGLGFLLWAFGSWWMPLLLGFAIGRHVILHEHLRYEPAWWSMVFPLGMYAVASTAYGRTGHMGFMVDIARGEVWLGFAAWLGG
jgi:tellurite resistance protein TehA-like permease